MSYRFELAVWQPGTDRVVPIAEYLQLSNEGSLDWRPHLENSAIILRANKKEWLGNKWNMGALELIAPQLQAAYQRLVKGQDAIIRSAVDDEDQVPYLLIEPQKLEEVSITLFFIIESPFAYDYPIDRNPGMSKRLYKYVQTHKSDLVASLDQTLEAYCFQNLFFPYGLLVSSLEREARLGQTLLKVGMEQRDS